MVVQCCLNKVKKGLLKNGNPFNVLLFYNSVISGKFFKRIFFNLNTEVLKNKLCKCNNFQIFDHTEYAANQGNAEERPDAGCEIFDVSSD